MSVSLTDIFFPKRCVGCKAFGSYLCLTCYKKIKAVQTPLCLMCDRPAISGKVHPACKSRYAPDGVISAYIFDTPIKELLHTLKYRGVTDITRLCAHLMAQAIPDNLKTKEAIIIPVPLHISRKRERGFNQSEKLGMHLSHMLELPLDTKTLIRTKPTKSQTRLNRQERKTNVQNVFDCIRDVHGKHILLIDDTVTTGATLASCAQALKRAGAVSVWGVALAQAPLARYSTDKDV